MKLSKLDRDSLIKLSKEKKVFLEGNIIKLIVADDDDNDFKQYLNDCKVRDNGSRRKRLEITKQVQIQNNELVALNKENERINKELKESLFYYTTYEYKNLNQSIRSNLLLSNENRKHYNNILSIFESGPIIKDTITVFRGMTKKYSIIDIIQKIKTVARYKL